jgi:hypothetical protein
MPATTWPDFDADNGADGVAARIRRDNTADSSLRPAPNLCPVTGRQLTTATTGRISGAIAGRIVPGSAWPGACNLRARCICFRPAGSNSECAPWHPARGLCGIRPVASGSVARAVHCITAGGMADLADCRNTYTDSNVLGSERCRCGAGNCHWLGSVSRPTAVPR